MNVGDKVKVRSDLKNNNFYRGDFVVWDMLNFCGKLVTIKNIDREDGKFTIIEDGGSWYWTTDMLDLGLEYRRPRLDEIKRGD